MSSQLPVLLVSHGVVFPGTTARIPLRAPHNVRMVEELILRAGGNLVLLTYKLPPTLTRVGDFEQKSGLCCIGTAVEVLRVAKINGSLSVTVRGLYRAQLTRLDETGAFRSAETRKLEDERDLRLDSEDAREFAGHLRDFLQRPGKPSQQSVQLNSLGPSGRLETALDLLSGLLHLPFEAQLELLREAEASARAARLQAAMTAEIQGSPKSTEPSLEVDIPEKRKDLGTDISRFIESLLKNGALPPELVQRQRRRGQDTEPGEQSLEERIRAAEMPSATEALALKEARRLGSLPPMAQERASLEAYVDLLLQLPWTTASEDRLDVAAARQQLDADHFGLGEVKRRILEYLAVSQLKGSLKGPILCFVGPPGVGKTSVARSIATAVGRKFTRISLGGISDQSEIRGHRRTYLGSMAGRIIQGIRDVGVRNPVLLLDEIDKMSAGIHGDPAAALLEVLDPEQNNSFTDHYLNTPFDLSGVLFIATANRADGIPAALLDRMELIRLGGYTAEEKLAIAKAHLLPKQRKENGFREDQLVITDAALKSIASSYTREAGVRGMERKLGAVCRAVALRSLEAAKDDPGLTTVDLPLLREILGAERFGDTVSRSLWDAGVAAGLAWSETGGTVLLVEATRIPEAEEARLRLTGQLGDVMQESAQIAFAWLRANGKMLGLSSAEVEHSDVHVHFPAGAVSKDGPSAGVTVAAALASLFTGRPTRADTAMTGELTLRGLVLPVGGIKEKLIAAKEAGFSRVLIPARNRKDLAEVPESVKASLTVICVHRMEDVIREALERGDEFFHPNIDLLFDFMAKL